MLISVICSEMTILLCTAVVLRPAPIFALGMPPGLSNMLILFPLFPRNTLYEIWIKPFSIFYEFLPEKTLKTPILKFTHIVVTPSSF